jgi:hypothetical protein
MAPTNAKAAVHPDVAALRENGLSSLLLAIELFNRPTDRGRAEAVLILLHHSFEMLLKSAIVAKDGKPCIDERGFSSSFNQCLEIGQVEMGALTVDQRRFLAMLDNLRDSATHYYQVVSEDLLYLFAQGSVSLFGRLLKDATGSDLHDHIPARVLPIFCRPPKDIHTLIADEFERLRSSLRRSEITREQAIAAIRPLVAFSVGGGEMPRRMTTDDVEAAVAQLQTGEAWQVVFPEVAQLRLETEGGGLKFSVQVVRDGTTAIPVRVLREAEEVPEGFIVAKEINVFDKFTMGLHGLAQKLGLTPPKAKVLIQRYKIEEDDQAFREVRVRTQTYRNYSKRALDLLEPHTSEAEQVWEETRELMKRKPR